jgi:hypothetical protein
MFRAAFAMDVGILPKLFGIEAGLREQSKLLQSPPDDLVSAAGRMATAGVSGCTRVPVVSMVGCAAAAGDSVGAGVSATESWVDDVVSIDGVSVTTGAAIAGSSVAGRTTSAGVVIGAGRTVIAGNSATGPASAGIVANEETHAMATIANRFMIISFNIRVISALRSSLPSRRSLRYQHHCWCGALCNAYCGAACDCKTLLATLVIMPSRPTIANRCRRRRMGTLLASGPQRLMRGHENSCDVDHKTAVF